MRQFTEFKHMHRVTLTFLDAAQERRFGDLRVHWIRTRYRGFLFFIGTLTGLSILLQWFAVGIARPTLPVMIIEASFALSLICLNFLHRTKSFARTPQGWSFTVLATYMLMAGLTLVLGRVEQQAPAAAIVFLVLLMNAVYPTGLVTKYGVNAVALVVHLVSARLSGFTHAPQFPNMLLLIAVAQFMCLAVSYLLERMVRATFFLNEQLTSEAAWSEQLLGSILPLSIIKRIAAKGPTREVAMVETHSPVSILFADLVGFTGFAATNTPEATVAMLNDIFTRFDALASARQVEKIKTMGDAYLAVSGLPDPDLDHAWHMADLALEMRAALRAYNEEHGSTLQIRIGIHSGKVVAGVIGIKKFHFDIWGDAVNTASRLESSGIPGQIVVSEDFMKLIGDRCRFRDLGALPLKGKGNVRAYVLVDRAYGSDVFEMSFDTRNAAA